VDPEEFSAASLGLHWVRSSKEEQKKKMIQNIALNLAQAGGSVSMILELIDAENMSELRNKVKKLEQIQQQQAQAEQQAEAAANEDMDNRAAALAKLQAELAVYVNDKKADRTEDLEILKASLQPEETPEVVQPEGDSINDIYQRFLDRDKLVSDERKDQRKTNLEILKLKQAEKQANLDRISKEKIEKLKASTALKNKTAGEKK
jgi:hypothetical protein